MAITKESNKSSVFVDNYRGMITHLGQKRRLHSCLWVNCYGICNILLITSVSSEADAMSGCTPIRNVNGTLISLILADFSSYPRSSAFIRVLFTKQDARLQCGGCAPKADASSALAITPDGASGWGAGRWWGKDAPKADAPSALAAGNLLQLYQPTRRLSMRRFCGLAQGKAGAL